MRRPLAALALVLSSTLAAVPALASPVSVSQSMSLPTVAPFGVFTVTDATLAGWSALWPFTSSSQISSVTLTFTSNDRSYNDPSLFPSGSGGGIPGVEIGVIEQGGSNRVAISSVSAAAPSSVITGAAPVEFAALVDALLDGEATFSLGGFVNFANGNPAFSTPASFSDGTLTVLVAGDVAATVPEPDALALVALALAALGLMGPRRRR